MTTIKTKSQHSKPKRTRRLSPSLLVSFVALFVALSGAAVALPGTETVNSGDIKDNSVKSVDLRDDQAVEGVDVVDETLASADVANDTLTRDDLAPASVGPQEIGDEIHRHNNSVTVNGGGAENAAYLFGQATATCGAGEELISGSGEWSGEAAGDELFISEVDVNHTLESVTVRGGNDSGTDRTLVAVASCLG